MVAGATGTSLELLKILPPLTSDTLHSGSFKWQATSERRSSTLRVLGAKLHASLLPQGRSLPLSNCTRSVGEPALPCASCVATIQGIHPALLELVHGIKSVINSVIYIHRET
mmetsp:Transcript_10377/g.23450  ORF Transcript_10377/g.23450 Transcript_10377/m.23450 type:complete len:112 (+) Transcript_10377:1046-1381(+)